MSILRLEIFKKMIKVVLVGRLFDGDRWIQLKIFGQRSMTELETSGLVDAVKGGLLNVQC